MKFTVEFVLASGGRLGCISQTGKHGNFTLETPLCTLFTKGGSAPYLSKAMLERIGRVPDIAAISINNLCEHHENVKQFGHGLGDFVAMENKLIFTTLHDASVGLTSGKNTKSGVAVWSKSGKVQLDPRVYMKMQEAFQPHWFQALSDGDTDETCGRKRLTKAVDRTLDFLDDIVELREKSECLKNSSLIGVIEGGFSEEERKRSALETAARPVQGFLIEGFEKGCTDKDVFKQEDFIPTLSKTISFLPEDKIRIMESTWSPLQVIRGFRLGIDVFSSSYPHTLTEKGFAMALDFSLPSKSEIANSEKDGKLSPSDQNNETDAKMTGENQQETKRKVLHETQFYLNLKDKRYFEDFSPLVGGCQCYACANFTRSYLHHLLTTSELQAYILLTIHNFHMYFEFFQALRDAMRNKRLDQLEDTITKQSHIDTES